MRGCLQSVGRPLPTTKLDLIASLFWNVLRQVLHRAGFCRVVEWKATSLWRSLSDHDIKLSARDAAVVYHKLLQLHLTGLTSELLVSCCCCCCYYYYVIHFLARCHERQLNSQFYFVRFRFRVFCVYFGCCNFYTFCTSINGKKYSTIYLFNGLMTS